MIIEMIKIIFFDSEDWVYLIDWYLASIHPVIFYIIEKNQIVSKVGIW